MAIEPVVTTVLSKLGTSASKEVLNYLFESFSRKHSIQPKLVYDGDIESLKNLLRQAEEKLGVSEVQNITVDSLGAVHKQLGAIRNERLRQARTSFNVAMVLVIIGVLIIFVGIGLLFAEKITAGTITAAAGGIIEVISGILFWLYNDTNNRLDKITQDLLTIERARYGMKSIENITEEKALSVAYNALAKELTTEIVV